MIERHLDGRGLLNNQSNQTVEVSINSFRVRSGFSAVMFGFMAGSDSIQGVVAVKNAAGQYIKRAEVSASYALGGIAGGQDSSRMGWLYEEFAKHVVAELTGEPVKK